MTKPLFLISCYESPARPGDYPANGGMKVYNHIARVLNARGYEAYVVTHTGEPVEWMATHATYKSWDWAVWEVEHGRPASMITGWFSEPILKLALLNKLPLYWLDHELAHTINLFKGTVDQNIGNMKVAVNNRFAQAWYMANYGVKPALVCPAVDTAIFHPGSGEERKVNRVGFFFEGENTVKQISVLGPMLKQMGTDVEFFPISGNELEVADKLRTCNLVVVLKQGKHPLWGEGYDLTGQEAMCCGAIPVAFDLNGNREYIYPGENGIIVPMNDINRVAYWLNRLIQSPQYADQMRKAGVLYAHSNRGLISFSQVVLRWLGLEDSDYAFTL